VERGVALVEKMLLACRLHVPEVLVLLKVKSILSFETSESF
jgi:hypothetical protein